MLKRRIIFICMFLALTGCSGSHSGNSSSSLAELITLEDLLKAMEEENLELISTVELAPKTNLKVKEWEFKNVKPKRFYIARPMADQVYYEELSVYIFESEFSRMDGMQELITIATQKDDFICYEHKNVIILYWYEANDFEPNQQGVITEKDRVDQDIKAALSKFL